MEIDYRNLTELITIRMKQIEDVSLEMDRFNTEYIELDKIRHSVAKMLILERGDAKMYSDLAKGPEDEE